jgi:DNA-binding Xre family transcriptional regulator
MTETKNISKQSLLKFKIRSLIRERAKLKTMKSALSMQVAYNQEQVLLCNHVGTSLQYLSRICSIKTDEQKTISADTLKKIASYFDCPIQNLYNDVQ